MLEGKNVVVTGVIAGESRITAEAKIRDAGGYVQSSVTKTTDLLVTGAKVGAAKTRKAAELGVVVVPWEQVWSGQGGFEVVAEAPKAARPKQVAPMLALGGPLPVGPEWSYEIKWDGYRCIATVKDGAVAMMSRSGKTDYSEQFPRIAAELATMRDCIIDGELVVVGEASEGGDFAAMALSSTEASFIVFDVIETEVGDMRALPLDERREAIDFLLHSRPWAPGQQPLKKIAKSPVFDDGAALLAYCGDHGLEGLVAKKRSSRYLDGARNAVWTKVKVRCEQEFAVVGYTAGEGRRESTFGALLLGYYSESGDLVFAGKVGTGWDDPEHDRLFALLSALPQVDGIAGVKEKDAVWVAPELVAQVQFQRWTKDGILWHPSYKGQRNDKDAVEVRREPCGAA